MPPKKGKTKQRADSSEDEAFKAKKEKPVAVAPPSSSSESDSESSDEEVPRARKAGGGFKGFELSSSSDSESDSDDETSSSESSESESESQTKEKLVVQEEPQQQPATPSVIPSAKAKGKAKAKAKPNTMDLGDIDDLLAEIESSAPSKPAPKAKATAKASAKKGAKKPVVADEEDDFDALLAKALPGSQKKQESEESMKQETVTPPDEEGKDSEEEGDKEVSAKTLKNRLKKQKKKQAATSQENKEESPTPAPKAKAKAKAPPRSAAALLAQKRLQLVEEQEKIKREEEERLREAEEKRLAEEREAERLEMEKKEKKRKAKQENKERLRKEGKVMTQKEKEKARKAEVARQQLLGTAGIEVPAFQPEEKKKKSRVVDDKKKKKKPKPEAPTQSFEEVNESKPEVKPQKNESSVSSPATPKEAANWEDLLDDAPSSTPTTAAELEVKEQTKEKSASKENISTARVSKKKKVESESEGSSSDESSEEEKPVKRKAAQKKSFAPAMSKEELQAAKLRSPICCILGHVDTGKTKLLDKIRHTNVQSNEAGGITQQIGATFFPQDALWDQCKKIEPDLEMRVPGLLIIDTPGHESFNNLRARGSSLCDIAILVVDIMHGLEPQTRESLGLLRARKCPFVVALNKIDRLYGWAAVEWGPAKQSLDVQKDSTQDEFKKRADSAILQLNEEGLNCSIWWTVDDVRKIVSIAPTSAITGEGIPDLLLLLVKLTQSVITKALVFREEFQCTILEVKNIEGLGTTVDVVLVSGTLYENDKIVVCGMSGPIVTTIRALLTPHPLKELRVKGDYIHHKEIHAAMGVKLSAQGLDDAVAGTSLLVARNVDDDALEDMKDEVMADMASIFKSVDRSGEGVYVMASTLGSLEALLQFLKNSNIPVFAVNLGTVHKLDVKKASVMREKGRADLSCILAFDVKVELDAEKEAASLGVRIFTADIIYHLFDAFTKYVAEQQEEKRKEHQNEAVFPCILSILPTCIFNKKDPIVLGVKVDEGILKINTPLCIPEKEKLFIGRVTSLEKNKKTVDQATKGDEIAIKIVGDTTILVGRHFDHTHKIYSKLSRDSINCLKEYFRDELSKDDWKTVVKMKKVLDIA